MKQQKLNLLLLEDNAADAAFLKTIVMDDPAFNISVHWEKRLLSGINYCKAHPGQFDVVLLDLSLPDGDGLNTVDRFREACNELPVIILTGINDEEMAVSALKRGAQDYIIKGQFERTLILKSIVYAIERHKLNAQLSHQKEMLGWIEKKLRTIITNSTEGILVIDDRGNILFSNPAAEKIFGRSQSELISNEFGIPILESSYINLEIFNPHQEQKFVQLSSVPINWEEGEAFLLTLSDITERRKAEEAISDSEEKFRAIASTATEGIIHIDEKNNIDFINDAACTIFDLEQQPAKSQNIAYVLKGNSALIELIEKRRALSDRGADNGSEDHSLLEISAYKLNGSTFPAEISLSFFRRKGRKQTVCIIRDISARKSAEHALIETKNDLKNALNTLKENQQRLVGVEKLNSVRELAGAIAHEFSQPLQALFNYFHLIKDVEPRDEYFDKINHLLNRISELKNSLTNITGLKHKNYLDSQIIDIFASGTVLKSPEKTPILIVDDEREILETLMDIFRNAGFECHGASDGTEALEMVRGHTYDLVLSDVMMQKMSGPEFYKSAREEGYSGKFIFITGYEVNKELEDIGDDVDGVITKPVAFQELLSYVQHVLNKPNSQIKNEN